MTTRYVVPSRAAYVGKVVVIVGGGGSAIDPDAQLFPGHSTDVTRAVPVPA